MKTKYLLLVSVLLMSTALTSVAQDATDKKHPVDIPFGKKLPPPDLTNCPVNFAQSISAGTNTRLVSNVNNFNPHELKKNPAYFRQLLLERRKSFASSPVINKVADAKRESVNNITSAPNFHLTKDINALAESNARNFTNHTIDIYDILRNDSASYAVLNGVIYFVADDGVHGNELWRSDGTASGTYMLKDLEPGSASSLLFNLTAANGKIYFTAYSSAYGSGAWVSDGTEKGTQLLIGVGESTEFFAWGNKVYFIADGYDLWSALWETDGTTAGTKQIMDLWDKGFPGQQIIQPIIVNDLLFFIYLDYTTFGWQLWRSDLTDAGTYHVGPDYPALDSIGNLANTTPAQLTNYYNKLYFSANDGTGRKLWVSDGTDAGTKLAPGNHNVLVNADYLNANFPILNNVLYIPGEKTFHGGGLYKYDASNGAGLVKIKDFAPDGYTAFVVPSEMEVVKKTLYFKVTNYKGGLHDELWSLKGAKESPERICKLLPGETINNLYNGSGIFYFVKKDKCFGAELWRTYETSFGIFPLIVSDIFKGPTSSYPSYLTAFKGKLIFGATDEQKGAELYMTTGLGTDIVKDINTVSTTGSNAGFVSITNLGFNSVMAPVGNDVLFNAYERVHGDELYKSDGTTKGTKLLNDVIPGETGNRMRLILSKNNMAYFIAYSNGNYAVYRSNGIENSLRKLTPDFNYIQTISVADNGIVFYTVYNYTTFTYELWRTDGTTAGNILLSSTLNYYNSLNVVGNTAFFAAGDAVRGYELWKSNGSVSGTKLVKDINPGISNSSPAGMFIYKNEVYFAAFNGFHNGFWKSDGTGAGTILLKNTDPWYSSHAITSARFNYCISNNILYFAAIDTSNEKGSQVWKTDGTVAGTKVVADINPTATSYYPFPRYFTDVNGTVFFVGDDGVHGAELWKTDGTKQGTHLVKDITPGIGASNINGLTSFGGKLYFQNAEVKEDGFSRYYLWSSDGTAEGTNEVGDFGISNIAVIVAAGNNLFLTVYTQQLGAELYAGKVNNDGKLIVSKVVTEDKIKATEMFDAVLYPNPAVSNAILQITGNIKNMSVSITDLSGKKLWHVENINSKRLTLPTNKYPAGIYMINIMSGAQSKTIRLVKQ